MHATDVAQRADASRSSRNERRELDRRDAHDVATGAVRYFVRVNDAPPTHDDDASREADEIELLRSTPVETILGNHVFHLLQLAAVHLAATPPNLPAAQLTIDVVSAMVKTGGERLGEHAELYRNAIAEVQQVYVRAATKSDE